MTDKVIEAARKAALLKEAKASVALDMETQSDYTIEPKDWKQEIIRHINRTYSDVPLFPIEDAINLAEEHFNKPLQELPLPQRLKPNEDLRKLSADLMLLTHEKCYCSKINKDYPVIDKVCDWCFVRIRHNSIRNMLDKEISRLEAELENTKREWAIHESALRKDYDKLKAEKKSVLARIEDEAKRNIHNLEGYLVISKTDFNKFKKSTGKHCSDEHHREE